MAIHNKLQYSYIECLLIELRYLLALELAMTKKYTVCSMHMNMIQKKFNFKYLASTVQYTVLDKEAKQNIINYRMQMFNYDFLKIEVQSTEL